MLTQKQRRFVDEYMIDLNATQAAIRSGYSTRTAENIGSGNLRKPEVAAAIGKALSERSERTTIDADLVLREIAVLASYDPADLAEVSRPGDIPKLPPNVRRAIIGWGWDRAGNFVLKLADKSRALDMLMRHLGQYHDRVSVGGVDGLGDRLDRAMAQLESDG